MPTRTLRILSLILMTILAPSAFAQGVSSLPLSIVEKPSISSSERAQIAQFVSEKADDAASTDLSRANRARQNLLAPLNNTRVSISFRRAYDEALAPVMEALGAQDNVGATLTRLRFAGELGTTNASRIIVGALDDEDMSVRIFAAGRAGRIFRTTSTNGPALTTGDLNTLIEKLGAVANSTDDPSLLATCVSALGQGGSLPSSDLREQRGRCIELMCDAASKAVRDSSSMDQRERLAMIAAGFATNSLFQVGESATQGATKAAVALGADMVIVALDDVVNKRIPGVKDRAIHVALVQAGESLLYYAQTEHAEITGGNPNSVKQTNLHAQLKSGEDRDFRNNAALLLGPGSPIVETFGFADDRFVN